MSTIPADALPKVAAVVFLATLTVWFGVLAKQCFKTGPLRIVRLELAPTVASANAFLNAWRTCTPSPGDECPGDWQQRLRKGQAWDTWFICSYAPLCALLCWLAAARFAPVFPELAAAGRALAAAQLVAGALDFLENAAINKMIERGVAETPWPLISTLASSVKWLLLVAFCVYGISAVLYSVIGSSGRG